MDGEVHAQDPQPWVDFEHLRADDELALPYFSHKMLSLIELKVISKLLHMASATYAYHCCNDLDLTTLGFTQEEATVLAANLQQSMVLLGTIHPDDAVKSPSTVMPDWLLMSHFARRLAMASTKDE